LVLALQVLMLLQDGEQAPLVRISCPTYLKVKK
jgi:hypothetical protein